MGSQMLKHGILCAIAHVLPAPHVFKNLEIMTHTLFATASLTRILLYAFVSGLCGLTTTSSCICSANSMVFFSLLLPPPLWPPCLLVISRRFWKVLPHSFYKPSFKGGGGSNILCATPWHVSTETKTLFICSFLMLWTVITACVVCIQRKWLHLTEHPSLAQVFGPEERYNTSFIHWGEDKCSECKKQQRRNEGAKRSFKWWSERV